MSVLIGVSTYQEQASWRGWHRRASLVPRDFLDKLAAVGAVPVLLPPSGAEAAADVVARVDGVLLVGGGDVEPAHYGAVPGPRTGAPERARDAWELALCRGALARGVPFLGVCRGAQILNVARGGTLHQHLDGVVVDGRHDADEPVFVPVPVTFAPDALPGRVLGTHSVVSCHHHQGIDALGDGLVVTGRADDGLVEAVAATDGGFALGLQGHPEIGDDLRLFAAFVEAARERAHAGGAVAADAR